MTAQTILPANSASSGSYQVANSVRLFADTLMTMTPSGAPTNADISTLSFWCKLSAIGTNRSPIFAASNGGGVDFRSDDQVDFYNAGGSLRTTAKFRDVSAWYHIVLRTDTTDGTANDRLRVYVNGTQVTDFAQRTNPDQNANTHFGSAAEHHIGCNNNAANFFNGYLAEVCFIDGLSLGPDSFGEFDSGSGIWKPIKVSDLTFGKNGFYLEFKDGSNLGDELKGTQTADWSETNLTVLDQSTDTCTNNFITMNPLDSFYSASTFSEGNLKIVSSSGNYSPDMGTIGLSAGKWYWEVKIDTTSTEDMVGITGNQRLSSGSSTSHLGGMLYDFAYNSYARYYNNDGYVSYGATFGNNDIIGVALDLDSGTNTIQFYKNGSAQGSKNITHVSSTENGFYNVSAGDFTSGASMTFSSNFGSPPYAISSGNADGNGFGNFEYAVPSGYFAICTKNLASNG